VYRANIRAEKHKINNLCLCVQTDMANRN